jgi:predicted  nucleic acid-binding Zn-ribbon protein
VSTEHEQLDKARRATIDELRARISELEHELEDSRHETKRISELEDTAHERIAELESALEPLAKCGEVMPDFVKDDEPTVRTGVLTAGECRQAAEVLNRKGAQ